MSAMKNIAFNISFNSYEPHCEKTRFLPMQKQRHISCAVTAQLISAFVFATRIVQFLFFLNPKFQAASFLLKLYRPVCVGAGLKSAQAEMSATF